MNLNNLISSSIGGIHLFFAILALVLGTMVLFKTKGTATHKKIGYSYVASMLGVNITAFMIYRLFGSFGVFHGMAIFSLLTIMTGMLPMILKKPASYVSLHFNFMYWSVFGLYAAFMAETCVRFPDVVIESGIPNYVFYNITGVATGLTMAIGFFFSFRKRKDWIKFDKSIKDEN
ncbi:MAG: putative membrane protein [Maribacter sp.]|jgi:uncharacterized membrane protein